MLQLALKIPSSNGTTPASTQVPLPSGIPQGLSGDFATSGAKAIQFGLNMLFAVGVIIAVIFLIWSGIRYITSQGEPVKLAQAKTSLFYSIIGLVVTLGAFFIVTAVITISGGSASCFLGKIGQNCG